MCKQKPLVNTKEYFAGNTDLRVVFSGIDSAKNKKTFT
jgi:hypothetical protein